MKRTKNRTINVARTALAAVAALGMLTAFMGQGFADQARTSSASAYGLEATGLAPIARTPTAQASAPPDGSVERNATVRLPQSPLLVNADLVAKAEAHLNDTANSVLAPGRPLVTRFEPNTVSPANARAYAAASNVRVLVAAVPTVDCNVDPENVACVAAVVADGIESEASARCVNNQPVFDTGYSRARADALGVNAGQLTQPIVDTVLSLFAPGAAAAAVATIAEGVSEPITENGQQVGIMIDGLRINVLGSTQIIRIAHSEVRMPRDCGIAASPSPTPGARLAQTGGGGMSSILGASLLAGAVLMMVFVRKYRFSE